MSFHVTPTVAPPGLPNDGHWYHYLVITPAGKQLEGYFHGSKNEAERAAAKVEKRAINLHFTGDPKNVPINYSHRGKSDDAEARSKQRGLLKAARSPNFRHPRVKRVPQVLCAISE